MANEMSAGAIGEGKGGHLEKNGAGVVATKFDGGKTRVDLFPIRAYLATCQVFTYGAELYDVGNWKAGDGFNWSRLIASSERHLIDFKAGVDFDSESGLPVLAHKMCCDAMLLEHFLTKHGNDDRAKAQISFPEHEDIAMLLKMDPTIIERARAIKAARLAKMGGKS